ncbi:MAG TPA: transaldolase family protein [Actinomycetes bacterium]|nr:transaldolase family protein [Actinomycetes bacterium]
MDNLTRGDLTGGRLGRLVARGVRGVTSNPTIIAKAIGGSADYDRQLAALAASGHDAEASYWALVTDDLEQALAVLRPLYHRSGGGDGFVSVELAPALAHDTQASVVAARALHRRIAEPNLLVKIPATAEGLSINGTLLFGLDRYEQIIDAYLEGLEAYAGDLAGVHSVASFFVSRVDTEVDRRLHAIGTSEALALQGKAAVAQAKLAYRLFQDRFSGPRWQALAARGARPQRLLWASTSTKNPAYPDTVYVDSLWATVLEEQAAAVGAAFPRWGEAARRAAEQGRRPVADAGVVRELLDSFGRWAEDALDQAVLEARNLDGRAR